MYMIQKLSDGGNVQLIGQKHLEDSISGREI